MAWDAFLKLKPEVGGEALRAEHEGEIELLSFSLGGTNPASVGIGSGAGAGKVSLNGFTFTKYTDASSVELFTRFCAGRHFEEATVTLRKSGGEESLVFLTFKFENAFIENYDWSGSAGSDDVPTEALTMAFAKVEIEYNQQDERGAAAGAYSGGWDLVQNQKI